MRRRTSRPAAGPAAGRLRWRRRVLLQALLVAVLAFPAGIALGPVFDAASSGSPAPTVPPWHQVPGTLAPRDTAGSTGSGVEPVTASAPVPAPDALAGQLNDTLKTSGAGSFTGIVQDAVTGEVLFDRSGDAPRVPASNMKLFTAAAALRVLGPEHRFSTRTVAGSAPGSVVLTGGGDVLLASGESDPGAVLGHAGLATLAQSTVRALKDDAVSVPLTVQLDDSLFSGPALNPAWSLDDVAAGEMAPLFPLALNSARFDPAITTGPRPADPAMAAAEAFSAQLASAAAGAGLTVKPGVVRVSAAADHGGAAAPVLAEVQSATVGEQVDLLLRTSDNYLAETIGRLTALAAGKPGSNDGAVAAVRQQLEELEIPVETLRAADVSGLALANQVSARQLAGVVRAFTSGADTRLRAGLAGFPVAGLTGTLGARYTDASTARGAGLVRAKTGTLNTVIALSGSVVDADGRLLVFSFLGNGLTPGSANKAAVDRAAAVLAGCGCR